MPVVPERSLTPDQSKQLEGELTLDELGKALKETKRFKLPGPDGIPADLLKVFYAKIKHHLLNAFNYVFSVKRIHQSGRQGTYLPHSQKRQRSQIFKEMETNHFTLC